MSSSRCRPMILRNAFALAARKARAATFQDRRTPRGGSQNRARRWLEEALEEQEFCEGPASCPGAGGGVA
jgi:hypothetical protein